MEANPNVLAATIHGENRLSYGYATLATAVWLDTGTKLLYVGVISNQ